MKPNKIYVSYILIEVAKMKQTAVKNKSFQDFQRIVLRVNERSQIQQKTEVTFLQNIENILFFF